MKKSKNIEKFLKYWQYWVQIGKNFEIFEKFFHFHQNFDLFLVSIDIF